MFDISSATNIAGSFYDDDDTTGSIAPGGSLLENVTAAEYCSWLDYNVNSQLERFGVRNGGEQREGLLNEKWESLAVVPVLKENTESTTTDMKAKRTTGEDENKGEFFVLSFSDNDFITQDGYLKNGEFRYQDGSGYSLENQALLFRVQLPVEEGPLVG